MISSYTRYIPSGAAGADSGQTSEAARQCACVTYRLAPPSRPARGIEHGRASKRKMKELGVLTSVDIGLFTGPHQTSFSELSSFTIRLSEGDRPLVVMGTTVSMCLDIVGACIQQNLRLRARVCRQCTRRCDGRTSLVDEGIFVECRYRGVGDLEVWSVDWFVWSRMTRHTMATRS